MTDINKKRQSGTLKTAYSLLFILFMAPFLAAPLFGLQAEARMLPSNNADVLFTPPAIWQAQPEVVPPLAVAPALDQLTAYKLGYVAPAFVKITTESNWMEYFIQRDLRMGISYNLQFVMNLNVESADGKSAAVPDGYYQLQIAIVRPDMSNMVFEDQKGNQVVMENSLHDRYVTSVQRIVEVKNAKVGEVIKLDFPEITATSVINHLYVQLVPLRNECDFDDRPGRVNPCIVLDENRLPDPVKSVVRPSSKFRSPLFEMGWVPMNGVGYQDRTLSTLRRLPWPFAEKSLAEYVVNAQAHKNKILEEKFKRISPKEHAKRGSLHFVDLMSAEMAPFMNPNVSAIKLQEMLEGLLDHRAKGALVFDAADPRVQTLAQVLCRFLIQNNKSYNDQSPAADLGLSPRTSREVHSRSCARYPERILRFTRVTHVGQPAITDPKMIGRVVQDTYSFNIMANDMKVRSHSRDSFSNVSLRPLNLLAPILKVAEKFGFNLPVDAGHSVGVGNSRSRSQSGGSSLSRPLDFNYHVLQFPTQASRHCLEVRPAQPAYSSIYDVTPGAKNGVYVCASKRSDFVVRESYAHTFVRTRDSSTVPGSDPFTQRINLALRGDREISAFFFAVRDSLTPDLGDPLPQFLNMTDSLRFFATTPLNDPLEIVTPVVFPENPIPTFTGQLFGFDQEEF